MKPKYPKAQIDDNNTINLRKEQLIFSNTFRYSIMERECGILAHKAFYLPQGCDWIIVKDNLNIPCLVPLIKEDKDA